MKLIGACVVAFQIGVTFTKVGICEVVVVFEATGIEPFRLLEQGHPGKEVVP